MHYADGAMYRPLFETGEAMLQVAVGCAHNRCRFCSMYKGVKFAPSPRDEVQADIEELARVSWRDPERVFLTGGNAFCLPTDDLLWVAGALREKMPGVRTIGCFARVADVARKPDAELARLAEAGYDDLSLGAEGGLDDALAFMRKGHAAADIVEQCTRLDAVGIGYDLFFLAGMAGAGRWKENARATAAVYNQTRARRIMVHTMTPFPGTDLRADIEAGAFEPSSEIDVLRELREFVSLLEIETVLVAAHVGNTAPVNAALPAQREQLVEYLDARIERADETAMRRFRMAQRSM